MLPGADIYWNFYLQGFPGPVRIIDCFRSHRPFTVRRRTANTLMIILSHHHQISWKATTFANTLYFTGPLAVGRVVVNNRKPLNNQ
jgi:hypothetical protein